MNRRQAFRSLVGAAMTSPLIQSEVAPKPNRTSGATKVYSEICPLDDGPIRSVRLVVTLDECHSDAKFWHPLDFAKAAKWFAAEEERSFALAGECFGPKPKDLESVVLS